MHPPAGAGLVSGVAPLARLGPGLRWLARLALALQQSLCSGFGTRRAFASCAKSLPKHHHLKS